ncbi:hypothetical protein DIPPA_21825 [Diplonema papillatum]|nr:hypothetical protein DIPPA_21825 [Diplonema papillatum]
MMHNFTPLRARKARKKRMILLFQRIAVERGTIFPLLSLTNVPLVVNPSSRRRRHSRGFDPPGTESPTPPNPTSLAPTGEKEAGGTPGRIDTLEEEEKHRLERTLADIQASTACPFQNDPFAPLASRG